MSPGLWVTGPDLIFDRSVPITSGSHADGEGNCSVEILGLAIYGNRQYGFTLPCLDVGCQVAVVVVTDRISDEVKQTRRWRLLIARLATCHKTENQRAIRRSALWVARSIERLRHMTPQEKVLSKECNDVGEGWLAGEATTDEWWAAAEKLLQMRGPWAMVAPAAILDPVGAVRYGAKAVSCEGSEGDLIDWLDAFLDAHLKIMVDEGEAIPEDAEKEYLDFVAALDFEVGKAE